MPNLAVKIKSDKIFLVTTFPSGWLINIKTVTELYNYVVKTGEMNFLVTFKMSQDPLENFFSSVRMSCGNNNNPTAIQFSVCMKCVTKRKSTQLPHTPHTNDDVRKQTVFTMKICLLSAFAHAALYVFIIKKISFENDDKPWVLFNCPYSMVVILVRPGRPTWGCPCSWSLRLRFLG